MSARLHIDSIAPTLVYYKRTRVVQENIFWNFVIESYTSWSEQMQKKAESKQKDSTWERSKTIHSM